MRKKLLKILSGITLSLAVALTPISSYALADMEIYKTLPVQSNDIKNWPSGPAVSCYSAILIDADTGVILYEKNAHEKMYPASTTKLLTCLLAMEKEGSNLNDMVDFSWEAVMTVPWDSSNMGMDAGESMTLEECLYGILILSANEVSNAVAEYVSGDIDTFVDLMNKRATELGCLNTNFENPHGYTDPNHYTTAYDLSMIAKEFFKNELLSKISRTPNYHWYATDTQPDDIYLGSTNYFMKGRKYCEGLVGSKTGYTDESRNVLVTCAERGDMKLIAVVMKEETPYQYDDTNTLLDYGFSNFKKIKVSEYEDKYTVTDETFFHSDASVFGDSSSILKMDDESYIILPSTISFDELDSTLVMNDKDSKNNKVATVNYSYAGIELGSANIYFTSKDDSTFVFDKTDPDVKEEKEEKEGPTFIYINYILYILAGLFIAIILFTVIRKILSNFHFSERKQAIKRHRHLKRKYDGPSYKATLEKRRNKKNRRNNRSSSHIDL